jgi:DNA modification methylase
MVCGQMDKLCPSNPKQETSLKQNSIYPYYAGYSPYFVQDIIEILKIDKQSVILDPWNGSGTTTKVANSLGFSSYGFDINPVMVILAKERLVDTDKKDTLNELLEKILKAFDSNDSNYSVFDQENDPLKSWFFSNGVNHIRNLEFAIQVALMDSPKHFSFCEKKSFEDVSSYIALFYTLMFRILRNLLKFFYSSNPTWIKEPKDKNCRIDVTKSEIRDLLCEEFESIISNVDDKPLKLSSLSDGGKCNIEIGDSSNLPLPDASIDTVITSPPYCTRIDYAVSTKPELALLGYSKDNLNKLRREMIGTIKIHKDSYQVLPEWGNTCKDFIMNVSKHSSKASSTYYSKIHLQYFHCMFISLKEIDRLIKSGGKCVIVVQDSYYKEVRNDLTSIIIDMATYFRWKLNKRFDFDSNQTMSLINRNSKKYRNHTKVTESVLCFTKN